jgi:hypothetical protein
VVVEVLVVLTGGGPKRSRVVLDSGSDVVVVASIGGSAGVVVGVGGAANVVVVVGGTEVVVVAEVVVGGI